MSRLGWAGGGALLLAGIACGWGSRPRPPVPPLPEAAHPGLAQVDLERVHLERLADPSWPEGALAAAVAPDPTLAAAVVAWSALPPTDPEAVAGVWNAYMRLADEPWRIDAVDLSFTADHWPQGHRRPQLRGYDVVSAVPLSTGVVEVWRRVSGPRDDGALGVTRRGGPPVLFLEPIVALALDQVWPMLDPALDPELDELRRRFAPAVRAEVAARLTGEDFDTLVATAEHRYWLVRAAQSAAARAACGSWFVFGQVPWDGFDEDEQETLNAAVGRGPPGCPEVTESEALAFLVRSAQVRRAPGLRPALERLVALVARVPLAHEARHAYDLARGAPACAGCGELDPHEAAAYLSTWADPDLSALAAYQACAAAEGEPAIAGLSAAVGDVCATGPGADLASRAAETFGAWFGERAPIAALDPPGALPVDTARRGR